jgi:hypothetical protein
VVTLRQVASDFFVAREGDHGFGFLTWEPSTKPELSLVETWSTDGCYVLFAGPPGNWQTFAGAVRASAVAANRPRLGWFDPQGSLRRPVHIDDSADNTGIVRHETTVSLRQLDFSIARSTRVRCEDDRLTFEGSPAAGHFVVGTTVSAGATIALSKLHLLAGGPAAGTFAFDAPLAEKELRALEAGVLYFDSVEPAGAAVRIVARRFPILDPGSPAGAIAATFFFDPLDLARTKIVVGRDGRPVPSWYRTTLGHPIDLIPADAGAAFVFSHRPTRATGRDERAYYAHPIGAFRLVPRAGPGRFKLLCGDAGTEHFTLGAATGGKTLDEIVFERGPAFVADVLGKSGGSRSPAETSWVRVRARTSGVVYGAQPRDAPLHGRPKTIRDAPPGMSMAACEHVDTVVCGVEAGADSPAIPLVPLAGLGTREEVTTAVALEASVLGPARRRLLAPPTGGAFVGTARGAVAEPVRTATPSGLVVELDAKGAPATLVLARSKLAAGEIPLRFAQLRPAFADALLREKVFAVVDGANAGDAYAPGADEPDFGIDGWPFRLNAKRRGFLTEGVRPLATIFKFYTNASIEELLDQPDRWSFPAEAKRPRLRDELAQYICAAKRAAGLRCSEDSPPSSTPDPTHPLYAFCELVARRDWQGILVLDASVDVQTLPDGIAGIMGGIPDFSGLRAHHLGIELSDVGVRDDGELKGQLDVLRTSSFGLIDYRGPSDHGDRQKGEFTFAVPELRLRFANSKIAEFHCRLRLGVRNLFHDAVKNAGPAGRVIELAGKYEDHGGTAVYSFVDRETHEVPIDSDILEKLTLRNLRFATLAAPKEGNERKVTARFSMDGALTFAKPVQNAIDLFSFRALEFKDLGVRATFALRNDKPENLRLLFDPGVLRFDVSASVPRDGRGLVSQLPLQLRYLLYAGEGSGDPGTERRNLSALGFFDVLTSGPGADLQFGLGFDLDLGVLGNLVGAGRALRAELLLGWSSKLPGGKSPFVLGIKLPEASGGRREIGFNGIFRLVVERFGLKWLGAPDTSGGALALVLAGSKLEVLGLELPPDTTMTAFVIAPGGANERVTWYAGTDGEVDLGTFFKIRKLAIGQRIRASSSAAPSCQQILDGLPALARLAPVLEREGTGALARYRDPSAGWLVALDLELKIVPGASLGIVMNDPTVYCLKLALPELVKGLEVAYRKIADSVGVYAIDLASPWPDIEVGAASLRIPNLGVSVFTDGGFRIDVGFPSGFDFSRSCAAQMLPFTGAGGLYFAKLSGAASALLDDPAVPRVFQAGFALRVGLGKDFKAGLLSAGISVTVFGVLEGALGYRQPGNPLALAIPSDLAVLGRVGIIGQVYGAVDFGIVKAGVSIMLGVEIGLKLRVRKGELDRTVVWVQATVDVAVEIVLARFKIFGATIEIRISFHFTTTLRFDWVLVSGKEAPGLRAATAAALAAPLAWLPGPSAHFVPRRPLRLVFTPDVTVGDDGVPRGVALLTIHRAPLAGEEASPAPDDFGALAEALLAWTLRVHLGTTLEDAALTAEALTNLEQRLHAAATLARTGDTPMDHASIVEFLKQNFEVEIAGAPKGTLASSPAPSAVFPMIPDVTLVIEGEGEPRTWAFARDGGQYDEAYQDALTARFARLFVEFRERSARRQVAAAAPARPAKTLATMLFEDWFDLVLKAVVHEARQALVDEEPSHARAPTLAFDALIARLRATGAFARIAVQVSHFFLGGLRIPAPAGPGSSGVFATSGQQFALFRDGIPGACPPGYQVRLDASDAGKRWLKLSTWSPPSHAMDDAGFTQLLAVSSARVDAAFGTPVRKPYLRARPRTFALPAPASWTRRRAGPPETTWAIHDVPGALTGALGREARPIDVYRAATDTLRPEERRSIADPVPALRVEVALEPVRVPGEGQDDGARARSVYRLRGMSPTDLARLEAFIAVEPARCELHVLHRAPGGAAWDLVSSDDDRDEVLAVRSDVSVLPAPGPVRALLGTAPARVTTARLADAIPFLRLVREASAVNGGGFFLHHPGLPDELFTTAGKASVVILALRPPAATGGARPTLRPEDSALVVPAGGGAAGNDVVVVEAEGVLAHELAVEPGCVTFEVERQLQTAGELERQLEARFSLLEYSWSSTGFVPLDASDCLPVAARRPEGAPAADGTWVYSHQLPIYKFVAGVEEAPSRYAAVGKTLEVQLGLRDVYGNRGPSGPTLRLPICYFDPLIPPAHWPATQIRLEPDGPGALAVVLRFDRSAVVPAGWKPEHAAEALAAAKATYERVREQLHGPKISARLESPLAPDSRASIVKPLIKYVDAALAAIHAAAPTSNRVEARLPLGPILSSITAAEVRASLHVSRDRAVADEHARDLLPSVTEVSSDAHVPTENGHLERFAAALPSYVLARGPGASGDESLWVVGRHVVAVTAAAGPTYYAPRPLSNALLSGRVRIPVYAPDGTDSTTEQDVSDVDLDVYARQCFADIERFLAPESLVRARRAFPDADCPVDRILQAKRNIAEGFSGVVVPLFQNQRTPDPDSARRALREKMRADLRSAYGTDCILQFSLGTVDAAAPRPYGRIIGEHRGRSAPSSEVIGTARVEARAGTGVLDVVYASGVSNPPADLALDLTFEITHLSLGDPPDPDADVAPPTRWLKLVAPVSRPLAREATSIPIPLRQFPALPLLRRHDAVPGEVTGTSEAQRLASSRSWTYTFEYEHELHEQDVIRAEVRFNSGAHRRSLHAGTGLLAALVAFRRAYPLLAAGLARIAAGEAGDPERLAVRRLAALVTSLEQAFLAAPSAAVAEASSGPVETYSVKEDAIGGGRRRIQLRRTAGSAAAEFDVRPLAADGQEEPITSATTQGSTRMVEYSPSGKDGVVRRQVRLSGLDVIRVQDAWAGVKLARNAELGQEWPVRPDTVDPRFVYETPWVRFGTAIEPRLDRDGVYWVSRLAISEPDTIENRIAAALRATVEVAARIELHVSYAFDPVARLARDLPALPIKVPVDLIPAFDLGGEGTAVVAGALARRLGPAEGWLRHNPASADGAFSLDVTVYGTLASGQPIIRWRNLWLPLKGRA